MVGYAIVHQELARIGTSVLAGIAAAFFIVTSVNAAGGGLLRDVSETVGNATRKLNLDGVASRRIPPLLGDGPEAHGNIGIIVPPDNRGYRIMRAGEPDIEVSSDTQLLDYLDTMRGEHEVPATQIFSETAYFRLREQLLLLDTVEDAQVFLSSGYLVPVRQVDGPDGPSLALELEKNFLHEAQSASDVAQLEAMLRVAFSASDVRVISLFDASDHRIRANLDRAAGEMHLDLSGLSSDAVQAQLGQLKRRIVIVVGHVENGSFVVRAADGHIVARVPVAELEQIADKAGSSLILLGCDTVRVARDSSGLIRPIRDTAVSDALAAGLRAADYGGFLSALGTDAAPFLVRPPTAGRHNSIMAAIRLQDARELDQFVGANVISISIGGRAPEVVAERQSRIIPFVPVWAQRLYALGALAALFLVRSLWREWLAIFPILGWRTGARYDALRLARLSGFALSVPIVGALVLLAVPLAVLMFLLPFMPWGVPVRMLSLIKIAPLVLLKHIVSARRAIPRNVPR